ncbi:hypothetical protein [Longimicrobium sp.]|uniref:hypothetical protein n=1 Tax=Longimicrobium sp. TaxID=2029185 RepID=UPI003B3A6F7F
MTRKLFGLCIAAAMLSGFIVSAVNASAADGTVGSCPLEQSGSRDMAITFLEAPAYTQDAAALGLSPADTLGLRLLAAPADTTACAQLQSRVQTANLDGPAYLSSFFQVGDYYMIATVIHPDSSSHINPDGTFTFRLRNAYMAVADSTFQVIDAYGM